MKSALVGEESLIERIIVIGGIPCQPQIPHRFFNEHLFLTFNRFKLLNMSFRRRHKQGAGLAKLLFRIGHKP